MTLYEGPIATIIIFAALVLGAICFLIYTFLIADSPYVSSIFFRISLALTLFGAIYFGACKIIERLDITSLRGNILIAIIGIIAIVAQLIPAKNKPKKG